MPQVLMIFGCQRSGTSATLSGLQQLDGVKIFNETNDVIHSDRRRDGKVRIRLLPASDLREIFNAQDAHTVVIKPLVEAHRAKQLLDQIPGSKGLWLYRSYHDVVHSMIEKWGEAIGVPHIREVVTNPGRSWRSESLSKPLLKAATAHFDSGMSTQDAAALFWYIRNRHYFEQRLQADSRVFLMRYEKLVVEPVYIRRAVKRLGMQVRPSGTFYHRQSVHKGRHVELSKGMELACMRLYDRLNHVEWMQWSHPTPASAEGGPGDK